MEYIDAAIALEVSRYCMTSAGWNEGPVNRKSTVDNYSGNEESPGATALRNHRFQSLVGRTSRCCKRSLRRDARRQVRRIHEA